MNHVAFEFDLLQVLNYTHLVDDNDRRVRAWIEPGNSHLTRKNPQKRSLIPAIGSRLSLEFLCLLV